MTVSELSTLRTSQISSDLLSSIGVEVVGNIVATLPGHFDFGTASKQSFNSRLKRTTHQFSYQVQVVFGNKGNNLNFRTVVNGEVKAMATIEFPGH